MFTCNKCAAKWTGHAICHCGTCCRTFTTVGNFDKHRVGPLSGRRCADPATLKNKTGEPILELRTTGVSPMWATPGDPDINIQLNRTG